MSRRLLLVTETCPRPDGGGGAVQLDALIQLRPQGSVSLALVCPQEQAEDPWPASASELPRRRFPAPPDKVPGDGARSRPLRAWLHRQRDRQRRRATVPRLAREIAAFAQEQGAEALFLSLSTPTLIDLALPLASVSQLPLHVVVWDPPGYKLPRFGFRGARLQRQLERFYRTLEACAGCAVMTPTTAEEYAQRCGTRCVVTPPPARWRPAATAPESTGASKADPTTDSPLVILFAGSFYAQQEHRAFAEALADAGWRIGGRPVLLRLLTDGYDLQLHRPLQVELLGWRSAEETAAALATADIAYLPYWTDPRYDEVVRLAFPTKLALYLGAGKPVFFHGPDHASVARFFRRYRAGVACSSLDSDPIRSALEELAQPERYADAVGAAQRAVEEELSFPTLEGRYRELFGDTPLSAPPRPPQEAL
ncbi:MAG: hypothetical protein AAGD01_06610 [Acidobacteriota bacterium]